MHATRKYLYFTDCAPGGMAAILTGARMTRGDRWAFDDVPSQRGRVVVVTGANTGVGFETARLLAAREAEVVLACRDLTKAADAAGRIRDSVPEAKIRTLRLDLASLESVRAAADSLDVVDVVVNNAGALMRRRVTTVDGIESTLAVNHLGSFAFTGLLLGKLLSKKDSRVVNVSSMSHHVVRLRFDDLQSERGYRPLVVYSRAKLASLLCFAEFGRRLEGRGTRAVVAHPGVTFTDFAREMSPAVRFALGPRLKWINSWCVQPSAVSALSVVRAATDPAAATGDLCCPNGFGHLTGLPGRYPLRGAVTDPERARRIWAASESLTGVKYESLQSRT